MQFMAVYAGLKGLLHSVGAYIYVEDGLACS